MSNPVSPFEASPPTGKGILASVGIAIVSAAIVLIAIVLPAEYGIDPTGMGGALGLTALNAPAKTVTIAEVVGGNETYKEVAIPDFGEPVPLPNPAVFQEKSMPPKSEVRTITLKPGEQTEIKTLLKTGQMIIFSWQTDSGQVYVDFQGHEPEAGNDFWVRYEEQQSGTTGSGSLAAPFEGEHGWYWLNIGDGPVVITLSLTGYYEKIVDYGITAQG